MHAANIIVNLPKDEKHYDANPGETPDQILQRVTSLHPDWTSLVLVITR